MWLDMLARMKKQSGKTIDQIAAESGVPKGTLNKLFAGQTKDPGYHTLSAVVHCLGYTMDDLEKTSSHVGFTVEEMQHIKKYRLLNEAGKEKTDEYMDILLGNEDFKKGEKLLEVVARSGDHLQVPDNGALDDMVVSYPDDL